MSRRAGTILGGTVVLVAVIALAVLVLRPPVIAMSEADSDVTISCSASVGLDAARCRDVSDQLLRGGPPSFTFEMDDLARLELDRSLFGFGADCTAAYFIERYPGEAVFTAEVECPGP